MSPQKQEKYIMLGCVTGLSSTFVFSLLAQLFFPPDYSGEYPVYAPESIMIIEFGLSFFLLGTTLMGFKLEDEKKIIPAAGFAMLAISTGVSMSALFEITKVVSAESYEKFYFITISSNFMVIPAMVLIACHEDFQKWIRYFGLISCIPLVVATFLFLFGYRNYVVLEAIMNIGIALIGLVETIWAIHIYRQYRKRIKQKESV